MGKVVVEHYQSKDEGVYRLVVADELWHDVLVPVDARDEDAAPTLEARPVFVGHVNHEDFVFAVADERWKRKKPTEIAKLQRQLVAEAIADRAVIADAAAESKRRQLPGVGEEL